MKVQWHRCMSVVVLVGGLVGAGSVNAHHSVAMYDADKVVTVDGTVKEFQWSNPHVILRMEGSAAAAAPEAQLWTVEFTAPSQLARDGWSHSTLKVGDKLKVNLHPFRDGRLGGSFISVIFPDGQEMKR